MAARDSGSSRVKIEGSDAVHLTSMVRRNGGNNACMPAGTQVAPGPAEVLAVS